ncbi:MULTISPECIES: hypothetical protein [unclassified Winogradskyella]|uniref:hypothetical protein n=1 Tax=unclassified Winogradskyella TaxID=2615021 RepID=UPI0012F8325C|nr:MULTISPECIES: hypothetical protein [unclassified Winogradskyella]
MRKIICILLLSIYFQSSDAQIREWMTPLKFAQIKARSENKLIIMAWSRSLEIPFPAIVKDENGKDVYLRNLFESPVIKEFLWTYFIPVKVDDDFYGELMKDLKVKRSQSYIDAFEDDSLKIMDANGNIIGTSGAFTEVLNFSKFVTKYNLNTSFLKQELINYHTNKDFYSTFYLASKYIDYSILVNDKVRDEILELSNIYFNEAEQILSEDQSLENKEALIQRIQLTKLKQDLIKNKSRKVLRQLNKIAELGLQDVNKPLEKFLQYTAYRLRNDTENFSILEKDLSLLYKKQAQSIVDINR